MNNKTQNPFSVKSVCQTLIKNGLIGTDQAKQVLRKHDNVKKKLEARQAKARGAASSEFRITNPVTSVDVIVSLNLQRKDDIKDSNLDEESVFQALTKQWGLEYKKIDPLKLDLNLVTSTIPRSFAMKHLVLPIAIKDGCLTVATPDPFNTEVMEDIARASNLKVDPVVSSKTDIIKLINEFFGFKRSIAAAENQIDSPTIDLGNLEQYVKLRSAEELPSNDQHIVNAVNHLFNSAFDQRASDIHIEPKRDETCVRLRIDGVLHTAYKLPKKVHLAIVSRIKALSRLDMAEKRRPQDGRIKTDKEGKEVEIRVSTVPVAFGEKVVMRLMDPDILFQSIEKIGFTTEDYAKFNQFVNKPHGIVLVTGPTGSGKSTTLYSTLRKLSTTEINVTTIEDPIEMVHEEFNQIAVQSAVDVTFATILRTMLRQDPDIIMVGEMRDLETAENAVQAALTGHLVLSTLHTNDAPLTITRLLDIGVPSFLIQATLVGILAQRLVRRICEYCKESYEIDTDELMNLGLDVGKTGIINLHRGKGCIKCRNTGYLGRIAVFEVLPLSEKIKNMIIPQVNVEAIREQAKKEGMVTLRENTVKKLLNGETTHQEVLRVTR